MGPTVLPNMAKARRQLLDKPTLIGSARQRLLKRGAHPDSNAIRAIRTLRVKDWVFLRDTKSYSIFVRPGGEEAFGVLGLTDRVRDIVGSAGVAIETGVVRLNGKFVCDGLVTRITHLGPNYRKAFSRAYSEAKASGRFRSYDEA